MSSAARPKRAAETFARTHDRNKKPHFDHRNPSTLAASLSDDDASDGDDPTDLTLRADPLSQGPQTKRNAVNIDGYESDSDNDNFDVRAAERARVAREEAQGLEGSKEEEDEDMFADLAEAEGVQGTADGEDDEVGGDGTGVKRRKGVRFLEQSEIQGQVMSSTSGGRVGAELVVGGEGERGGRNGMVGGEDDEESSGSEEERDRLPDEMEEELAMEVGAGGKKRHAPRLDAFNLKNETEEGGYDEAGNYVRKAADPDAVNDNWLEGVSKKDIKKAREAQEKREGEQRRKAMEEDALLTSDLLSTLIEQLETSETAFEALARLNKNKPKEVKVPKWKQKKMSKDKMDTTDDQTSNGGEHAVDKAEIARREAIEKITGAADALYSRGQHEIYEAERELLLRQYRRETGDDWQPPAKVEDAGDAGTNGDSAANGNTADGLDTWQYRWSDARDGGGLHGPYDAATMKAWNDAGYFGEGVEFRRTGESAWSRLLDVK